jgi:peptide/nickel transport system substrate-binding protein
MMRSVLAIVIASAAALVEIACNPAPATLTGHPDPPFAGEPPQDAYVFDGEPGIYGGTLVLATPDDPKTFNIVLASDTATADILWLNVFRCPVDYRNAGEKRGYDPGLCTKWEVSPDGKAWTLFLRRGVRWSDGEPFDADDVLFSYRVASDENVGCPAREIFIEGLGPEGEPLMPEAEKIDDYTVRFNLHHPNANFLDAVFNIWLIPRHKWEGAFRTGTFRETMKLTDDPAQLVSLGPFRMKEYVSGQRVVLERNPYFWKVDRKGQRLPYLDRIVFVIAKDFNAVQAKFESGEIDLMPRVRPQDYASVKRLESDSVKIQDIGLSYDAQFLTFNQNLRKNHTTGKPVIEEWKSRLFRDQRFRQAISYAIDRQGLINTVYSARGEPAYSFVSPADVASYSDDIMKYPFDPDRARSMLASLGLKDTNGDGVLEDAEGHQLEIALTTNSSNSQRVDTAAFVAANLRDIGIKAQANPVALGVVVDMVEQNYNYDAVVLGWQVNPPPGLIQTKNVLLSSGAQHYCFPQQRKPSTPWEARIDQLVHEIESSSDPAEYRRKYAEIQRIWSEQLPEINLVYARDAVAYRTRFGNLLPAALPPRATWNAEEIYIRR